MRHCSAALAPVLVCVLGILPSSAQRLPNLGKLKPERIADHVKGKNLEDLVKKGPDALKQPIASALPDGTQAAAKAIQQGQEIAMEGAKKIAEVASAELGKESTNATATSVGAESGSSAIRVDTPVADTSARTSAGKVLNSTEEVQTRNLSSTQEVVEAVSQGLQDVKDAVDSSPGIQKGVKKLTGALDLPKPDQVKDTVVRGHQEVANILKKVGPGVTEALRKSTPAEGVSEVADTLKKEGEAALKKTDPVKDGVKDVLKQSEKVTGALKEQAEQAKDALKEPAEQAQQLIKQADSTLAGTIEKNAPAVTDVLKKTPTDEVQQLIKNTSPETVESLKKANPVPPSKPAPSPAPGVNTASGPTWQWTALGMLVAAAALMCGWYLFGRIKGREGRSPTLLVESEMSPWVQGGQMRGQPVAEEPLFRQF